MLVVGFCSLLNSNLYGEATRDCFLFQFCLSNVIRLHINNSKLLENKTKKISSNKTCVLFFYLHFKLRYKHTAGDLIMFCVEAFKMASKRI